MSARTCRDAITASGRDQVAGTPRAESGSMRILRQYLEWNYTCLGPQGFGALARDERRRLSLGLRLTTGA